MKLQTKIPLTAVNNPIDYTSQLLLLGSCFSEHIGRKLEYFQFRTLQNPFGILFHPIAIENLVARAVQKKWYTETDIFFQNERWHCFDVHSDLSDPSDENLLKKLNDGLAATLQQLILSSHIILTLGTVWIYRNSVSGKIVANCHKVTQKGFTKELLSIDTIKRSLKSNIQLIKSINNRAQFIFTVSPVRHLKDGFIENQRSKAHLISAVHEMLDAMPFENRSVYFPSYELQMDELRDYRFYGQDMLHPNEIAIDYIWEKFKQVWISEDVFKTMDRVKIIQKGLQHRPFHPDSDQHQKFKESLEKKITDLKKQYPFMGFGT